jgi:glycosyltransferase involved in cell wall biosynthesis
MTRRSNRTTVTIRIVLLTAHIAGPIVSDANLRQIRVLHIVSAGGVSASLQQSLFMPLLTRLPRPRVKSLVACLSPGAVPSAVLRQSGVPTYDLTLSRKRFSPRAFQELLQATRNFRPDVIQAWGHTAQIISTFIRPRCDWKPRLIWSVADTTPLAKSAGFIDRQKLKYAAKFASRADRIVYSSEAGAAQHRRCNFPEADHAMIPPGVDATRFKPDFEARRRLREQWNLPGEAFVIGMAAPFQPEYDHSTLIRAIGDLIKVNPNVAIVLAGHGVQKGNAPLMALVGSGALSTRIQLLGEWSDISSLYNACDVVCSSALNDQSRMNVVMAMLCGVPCVATGIGAQGEVIGQHGIAIEPGSPAAFVKGITRVMQMTPEKRTHMAQGARKHALGNYVYVRSLQKYLQLYYDLIGRQSLVTQDLPTPEVDPTLTVPPALPTEAQINATKRKPIAVADWGDPDSLESKVTERAAEELPKWRLEQEQERSKREAEVAAKVAATQSVGDVLQVFEARQPAQATVTPMTERARGVADDVGELLSPELLATEAPSVPRASNASAGAKRTSTTAPVAPPRETAKEVALKAARMAALQPIATSPKRAATVKPAAKPASAAKPPSAPSIDFNSTQPVELLPQSMLLKPAPAASVAAPTTRSIPATPAAPMAASATPIVSVVSVVPRAPLEPVAAKAVAATPVIADIGMTQPLVVLPEIDLSLPRQPLAAPVQPAAVVQSSMNQSATPPASSPTGKIDSSAVHSLLPEIDLSLLIEAPVFPAEMTAQAAQPAALPTQSNVTSAPIPASPAKSASSATQSLETLPRIAALEEPAIKRPSPTKATTVDTVKTQPREVPSAPASVTSLTSAAPKPSVDFSELTLITTGAWQAMQRQGAEPQAEPMKAEELSGAEALSLISKPTTADKADAAMHAALQLALLPEPRAEAKLAANDK